MKVHVIGKDGGRYMLCEITGDDAAEESRQLLEWLSEVMEAPIGRTGTFEDTRIKCPSCGRETSVKRAKRPFCAQLLEPVEEP